MKNILLPTDFSDNAWNAIQFALGFYKETPCNFFLLHVIRLSQIDVNDSPFILNQDVIEDVYAKPAKIKLHNLLKKISVLLPENNNHKFYTLTDYNVFIKSIKEQIEDKNIDMIIMGTKGASGLKKIIVGSNTGDVITKVPCTTLVVPENAKFDNITEIVFPTDFSVHYNINTLTPILEIVEKNEASLRIVHISKKEAKLNFDQKKNKDLLEDYFENQKLSFHFLTNKNIEDAVQCFVESRDVNMIAMVAKNLNYYQQILFHTKVEEISYHTEIPFLVLHN